MRTHDAVILGGGPAGSTVATILAQAGQDVVVIEKEHFPRYHIGESLLPATVSIFERLGVHERVRETSVHKPGGKWLYGEGEVPGDFSKSDRFASFKETPYSYLVERAQFDEILLQRSIDCGATVHFGHSAQDLILDGDRVVGVTATDEFGVRREFRGRLVFDATGLRAFVGSRLGIREAAATQRMGIYATYRGEIARRDADEGWFIGGMFYDGWTWLLNLPGDEVSIGAVLPVARFRQMGRTPEQLLDTLVHDHRLLRDGVVAPERISEVRVTGNMGNTCRQLAGNGWVTAGDAAFFIDPCYSSGVHLAMQSGERVADVFLAQPHDRPVAQDAFSEYESKLRHHQKYVTRMVEAFYMATRNTSLQKLILRMQGGYFTRKFVTFVGGDFSQNAGYISRLFLYSKFLSWLLPNNTRLPENRADYPAMIPVPKTEPAVEVEAA